MQTCMLISTYDEEKVEKVHVETEEIMQSVDKENIITTSGDWNGIVGEGEEVQ